jgi:hypothetical protein
MIRESTVTANLCAAKETLTGRYSAVHGILE